MKNLGLHELRKEYLEFFREKEHLVLPSFSLVPDGDDSLLLIGAGMAPLKKYFTGEAIPPRKRVTTCQKCIRTGDIENVGKTDRHATFFEMLGNFSFGDYFKIEAMRWAWEFLTDRLEIAEEDVWVSVFEEDDEAFDLWRDKIGLPEEKIVRLGKEDNFWELEVGPSGPCSEIFVDRGEKYGCGSPDCKPGCECDRFIEVWNLVFTQFDKDENGVYHPLEHPNIDTGMGLERLTTVLQGSNNIFEIEAIQDIIHKIEDLAGYKYGEDPRKDESVRVITDHSRAVTFLVSDGVVPGNEGRGYVLRRLARRALRHGKLLGIEGKFLNDVINVIIDSWKAYYEELDKNRDMINKIVSIEENRFQETIDAGIERLEQEIEKLEKDSKTVLSGEEAFKLYDTYGFPIDLTKEILDEKNLSVDIDGFNEKMEEQRKRARDARKTDNIGWSSQEESQIFKDVKSEFFGYEKSSMKSKIEELFKDNKEVEYLSEGDKGVIVLYQTPFYGESGGQVGDTGIIKNEHFKARVVDTQVVNKKAFIHMVEVMEGSIKKEETVEAIVDNERRMDIVRNHSATHLLHKALREVLGEHVEQAGSLVLADKLRFDFSHFEAMTEEEIKLVEEKVNSSILRSLPVEITNCSLEEAEEKGAIGLFEDKYGDVVRVVNMGDHSIELCGGIHVMNTSQVGIFKILSESGISSGVRRIEAITGKAVYNYLNNLEYTIDTVAKNIKSKSDNVVSKSESLMIDLKSKDKEILELKNKLASDISTDILDAQKEVAGVKYITYALDDMDMENLRNLGDELKTKIGSGVIVLSSTKDDKLTFLTMVTKDLNKKGILAGKIIKEVAMHTGGNGGGRPDMAQAGGKDISKVDEALALVPELIEKHLEN